MRKLLLICLICLLSAAGCAEKEEKSYACRTLHLYDYTEPVPASEPADDSYFADSLFVGDSRMGALALYGSHKDTEVYYVTSLNLLRIEVMPVDEHTDHTLMDYLENTKKTNIYMLFGINEVRSSSFDSFAGIYQEIIDMLKEHNPDVKIYIMLAYHPQEISGLNDDQLNDQLEKMNLRMKALAIENRVYYIDLDPALAGEDGKIRSKYTFDGLHMNPDGVKAMEAYIAEHTVREDRYVKEVCE